MNSIFTVAGIMSGTSLDGLDIALCNFQEQNNGWSFEVINSTTIPYSIEWQRKLAEAHTLNGDALTRLHYEYGNFIGRNVSEFCKSTGIIPDLVASHGHTVFHRPEHGYTLQIGSGAVIAATSGFDTVCDFRSADVALGGQGAPLVPVGDRYLFGGHRFCLNLGGFANISFERDHRRIAFDICPVNLALNFLSNRLGHPYDKDGELAMLGSVIPELLIQLNALPFYQQSPPKSLGREWFESQFLPLVKNETYNLHDRLRTVVEHIGYQIANSLFSSPGTTMLTTGGGAYHHLLSEVIEEHISRHGIHVVIPDNTIVEFKEAIIFGFLGLLRFKNRVNILSDVTGASKNSVGGAVFKGGEQKIFPIGG